MATAEEATQTTLALSNREEDELLKETKKIALGKCGDELRDFAECSTGRTFSVAWACRKKYRTLQGCMGQYTSGEAMAERRRDYLREKRARRAAEQHGDGDVTLASAADQRTGTPGLVPNIPAAQRDAPSITPTLKSSSSDAAAANAPDRGTSYLWNYQPAQRVV